MLLALINEASARVMTDVRLASCGPCRTDSGQNNVIVLLICKNGKVHHWMNVRVVNHP